tara:strand:- start:209 stop:445 length:237 start_codon:yes stop_codon:yes gene_type:complete
MLVDVQEALKVAERISEKIQDLSEEEGIDVDILVVSLVWAALGIGMASGEIEPDVLKTGLHLAIDSALADLSEIQTLH